MVDQETQLLLEQRWLRAPAPRTEMCCGTEAGSYLRLIDSCITHLKAQRPSRTCNESKEEAEEDLHHARPQPGTTLMLMVNGFRCRANGKHLKRFQLFDLKARANLDARAKLYEFIQFEGLTQHWNVEGERFRGSHARIGKENESASLTSTLQTPTVGVQTPFLGAKRTAGVGRGGGCTKR